MSLNFTKVLLILLAGISMLLSGCASHTFLKQENEQSLLKIAPPLPEYKKEVALAKLNEIIQSPELTVSQRARFLYERGVIYDSLGLRLLARLNFHQALKLQPNLADAFNFIGIYYTQENQYENAYESFDGVLELAPEYDYAYLNRGLALYYDGRYDLAVVDLKKFYDLRPTDSYRALWLYLVELKQDPKLAKTSLEANSKKLTDANWGLKIVDFYLGKITKQQLFDDAEQGLTSVNEYAQRLCETYFYLAKLDMAQGHYDKAANYLRLALATNIYDFVEHRYARKELAAIQYIQEQAQIELAN